MGERRGRRGQQIQGKFLRVNQTTCKAYEQNKPEEKGTSKTYLKSIGNVEDYG